MTRLMMAAVAVALVLQGAASGRDEKKAPAKPKEKEVTLLRALEEMEWTLATANARKRLLAVTDNQAVPKDEAAGVAMRVRIIAAKDATAVTGIYLSNLSVAADAKITLDGKEAKWDDLKPNQRVKLRLKKDSPVVTDVTARTEKAPFKTIPPVWKLKAVDAKKDTVTLTNDRGLVVKGVEVAKDARLSLLKVGPGVHSTDAKLADLKVGDPVAVELRGIKGGIQASALATAK